MNRVLKRRTSKKPCCYGKSKHFALDQFLDDGIYFVCNTHEIKTTQVRTTAIYSDKKRYSAIVLVPSNDKLLLTSLVENIACGLPIVRLEKLADNYLTDSIENNKMDKYSDNIPNEREKILHESLKHKIIIAEDIVLAEGKTVQLENNGVPENIDIELTDYEIFEALMYKPNSEENSSDEAEECLTTAEVNYIIGKRQPRRSWDSEEKATAKNIFMMKYIMENPLKKLKSSRGRLPKKKKEYQLNV